MIRIVHNKFELCAGMGYKTGPISFADDDLFPSPATEIGCIEEFLGKPLTPLNEKLLVFSKLSREIIGKIQPEAA